MRLAQCLCTLLCCGVFCCLYVFFFVCWVFVMCFYWLLGLEYRLQELSVLSGEALTLEIVYWFPDHWVLYICFFNSNFGHLYFLHECVGCEITMIVKAVFFTWAIFVIMISILLYLSFFRKLWSHGHTSDTWTFGNRESILVNLVRCLFYYYFSE